jgi:hypothetical protein
MSMKTLILEQHRILETHSTATLRRVKTTTTMVPLTHRFEYVLDTSDHLT